jgi:hypothetical protein
VHEEYRLEMFKEKSGGTRTSHTKE